MPRQSSSGQGPSQETRTLSRLIAATQGIGVPLNKESPAARSRSSAALQVLVPLTSGPSSARWRPGFSPPGRVQVAISGVWIFFVVRESDPISQEVLHIADRDRKPQVVRHIGPSTERLVTRSPRP